MSLPFDELLGFLPRIETVTGSFPGATISNAERVLGVGRQRLLRWEREGLNVYEADRAAGLLKRHPSEIWPEWFEGDAPRCEHCGEEIPVERDGSAYCSNRHRNNETARRRRERYRLAAA